jgi:N-ethylmaleimide reductase
VTTLFNPIQLGALSLPNRIIMAPMTRARCTRDHVPTPIMAEYYAQRASAGLIISEATAVSKVGMGWPYAPGIWNAEQLEAWKSVTTAVHESNGLIICQLWHMGRQVHPTFLGGELPVSASDIAAPGDVYTYEGKLSHVAPRPLDINEIPALIDEYRAAARRAMLAGFDGVQLHAAHGYLLDQFLRDNCNFRTDRYGGPPENRIRLLGEIARAVAAEIGADRLSIRISPVGEVAGVDDSDPKTLFTALALDLNEVRIGFLEIRDTKPGPGVLNSDAPSIAPLIRKAFEGPLVLNFEYSPETAQLALDEGAADAISFGTYFISNPDLPRRIAEGLPLAPVGEFLTLYNPVPEGYADYPPYPI